MNTYRKKIKIKLVSIINMDGQNREAEKRGGVEATHQINLWNVGKVLLARSEFNRSPKSKR